MNFNKEKFSKAIQSKIKKDSILLIDAAKQSELSITTFQRMSKGTGYPRVDNILKVCSWLNKPITRFIDK